MKSVAIAIASLLVVSCSHAYLPVKADRALLEDLVRDIGRLVVPVVETGK